MGIGTLAWPGLLSRLSRRVAAERARLSWSSRAGLLVILTWVPLVLLASLEGLLVGPGWVLSRDIGAHVRLLWVGPLLLLTEPVGERWLSDAVAGWRESHLVGPGDRPRLDRSIAAVQRALASIWLPLLAAVAGLGLSVVELRMKRQLPVQLWHFSADGGLSWTGWWYALVSVPLMGYLLSRWLLRFLFWSGLVVRLASLKLELSAAHPDHRGGLGELAWTQGVFSVPVLALSSTLAGGLANQHLHLGRSVMAARIPALCFVVLVTALVCAPLMTFTPGLVALRRHALGRLSWVGRVQSRYFEDASFRSLRGAPRPEGPLRDGLTSTQTDYVSSFDVVERMRAIVVTPRLLLLIALAAALPLLAATLVEVPLLELLGKLKALFH